MCSDSGKGWCRGGLIFRLYKVKAHFNIVIYDCLFFCRRNDSAGYLPSTFFSSAWNIYEMALAIPCIVDFYNGMPS